MVSYIGYETQELKVDGRTRIDITIKENEQVLDEVVVVGYGTMKKSDMTGAISSVSGKDLAKRATTNPAEALQGKIAGVNIMKSGGNAGAGVSVKIRGVKTFGNNEPLYIIDGFPGDINAVNPQDIQSLEVLKDGAAAAIYGSVAANGVVLITTKSGAKGDVKVDFTTYLSWTNIANKLEMLDADAYNRCTARCMTTGTCTWRNIRIFMIPRERVHGKTPSFRLPHTSATIPESTPIGRTQ